MGYKNCKLLGAGIALCVGLLGRAHGQDFLYHCDEVLFSAKTSMSDYQVTICTSGRSINFNYGPVKGPSEVDVLLSRQYVYYVPEYNESRVATGKVGLKFDIGRYHYYIHDQVMTFRVGDDIEDTETVPLRKPQVDLNVAKLVKHKLKPE